MKENFWLHKTLCLLLILILISASGCKEDEPVITPPPPDPGPQQYGTPFDAVPETAEIQMYEVNPRVFSAAKNLQGITNRLDSLQSLGINVVWLMPIYPTGSVRSVGSPYAIRDYFAVNPEYGSLDDLRALVEEAHRLGMAVILDWVANHTSWDNEWIQNRSWYSQDANGNIIHPPGTNWQDVADLDFSNSEMKLEMIKAMKYWVLEANVDGYRCDYASGVPTAFWKQAIDTLRNIPGRELIMFAEAEDKPLLTAGFDLIFGWPFYGKLKDVFGGNAAKELYTAHINEYNGLEPGKHILRWTTNHDQHAWDATPQQVFGDADAARAAFVLAAYMGGVPLVYNGQEVDVPNQLPFFEGNNVTINWNMNPETQAAYKEILNFRKASQALKTGTLRDFSSTNVSMFKRSSGAEEVLVVVNVRNTSVNNHQLPAAIENTSWFRPDGTEVQLESTLDLGPYEFLILKNQ